MNPLSVTAPACAVASPALLRLVLLTALSLALAACGKPGESTAPAQPESAPTTQAEPAAESASAKLDRLISEFAESRQGEEERSEMRDVSVESFLAEIESDRRLLQQLGAIDPGALVLEERIDRSYMIGVLQSEIYGAEERRAWENEPSLYIPAYQVGRLLEPQAVEPAAKRAADLEALLAKIPERFEAAKRNLGNPPKRFTEDALFKVRGTLDSLEQGAAALAGEPGSGAGDEFHAAVSAAVASLREFEAWLETEVLPRSTGSWAIGKEHYDHILKHRWHLAADADAILARGQKAFEETEALAQEVSERIEPGKHWSEVYETLKDDHPPADGIKQAYQQSIDAARAFVIEHQIVTLPEGERVITVDTPPAMRRSSPFGTFQSVDPLGTGLEGQLVLTPIEDWMTPEQQAARLRSHHHAWIPIIAVHEAYPGHHVDALKTRENPRLLRKVVREAIFSEGWGLFTEEMMYEAGFLQGDDVRLTQLRNRLWRAARVILDVSLHTGRMTFEEAVDFLAEKVRFERYAAELEVGMYTERPTYVLGYLIGMQDIAAIRDEYVARFGEPVPPSRFYDALLSVGSLPPVLVRASLFGEEPGVGESQP